MIAKRVLFEELLCNIVYFALFYGIFVLIAAFILDIPQPLPWVLLGIIPFMLNFLARRYIRSTILMIIAHMVVPVLVFFTFEDIIIRVFALAMLVAMLIYSFIQRAKGKSTLESTFSIFASIGLVAMCFIGLHFDHGYMAVVYPILIVIVVIGGEIYTRMSKVDMSLEVITKTTNQPIHQILKLDHKMMLATAGMLLLLTFASQLALVNPLLEQISRIPLPRYQGASPSFELPGFNEGSNQTMPINPMLPYDVEIPDPHPFWEILNVILMFLVQALTILLLLALLISGIITAYKMMNYRKRGTPYHEGEDEKIFIIPERVKKRLPNLMSFFSGPENKTRRLFRKKIMRHRKMGVPIVKSDTPAQMASRIEKEDIKALTTEYEKVRYGMQD